MRLDLREFQRRRSAGLLLIGVAVAAALIAAYFMHREAGIANYYFETTGNEIPNAAVFDRIISTSGKPVAVMFESPTCPACKRMRPYWRILEARSGSLPVEFYHIVALPSTIRVFERYGVEETPTFIVFVNGKPVARKVGVFEAGEGERIEDVMLSWALAAAKAKAPRTPREYAERGLEVYRVRCASCHGVLEGLSRQQIEEWLRNAASTATAGEAAVAVPALRERIEKAVGQGKLLSETDPEGFQGLVDSVLEMRKYVPDLLYHEALWTAYMLDYATAVLENREPPVYPWMKLVNATAVAEAAGRGREETTRLNISAGAAAAAESAAVLVGAASALVAGVVSVFSPCVLPLLIAQVSVVARGGRRLGAGSCLACGAAAAAGVLAVGALFLTAAKLAAGLQQVLLPVVAAAIVAAGLASMLGVPVELEGLVSTRRGGLLGFCGLYGFLAVQCNLPIVLGVLLLIAGLGLSVGGLAALAALALGSGVPLALVMWVTSRGGAFAEKMLEKNRLLSQVGGAVLFVAGVYLLLYSLQVV